MVQQLTNLTTKGTEAMVEQTDVEGRTDQMCFVFIV